MKNISPTLPKREGIADRMSRLSMSGRNDITPSLWGRIGVGLLCLIQCGCITEYEATGIDEVADILVVEGVITDDATTITLSRSTNLTGSLYSSSYDPNQYGVSDVYDAKVYVECDDGTQWQAGSPDFGSYMGMGSRYTIKTGQLDLDHKYCLKIEIEENDYDSNDCSFDVWGNFSCPKKTYKYSSDYSYPIKTPEIDSIFWMRSGRGQPVWVYIATHSPDQQVLYYRWSYKEDWEINSDVMLEGYPYYCWNQASSRDLLIGSAEKTVFGQLTDVINTIYPSDRRLSVLYRINIRQNSISKRAYDYFANIKKNSQQSGSIFAPVPSELRGNIVCTTDPNRVVIGYVDISTTTQKTRYISRRDNLYEPPHWDCDMIPLADLLEQYDGEIPYFYVVYDTLTMTYVQTKCVNCTFYGTTQKPDDWPDK